MDSVNHRLVIVTNTYLDPSTGTIFSGGEQRVYQELSILAMQRGWEVWILQEGPDSRIWNLANGLNVMSSPRRSWWGRIPAGRWARSLADRLPAFQGRTAYIASYPSHLTGLLDQAPWLYQHGVNWDGTRKGSIRRETRCHLGILPRLGGVICVDTNYANVMAAHSDIWALQAIQAKLRFIPNFQAMEPSPLPAIGPEGVRFLFPRNFVEGRGIWLVAEACERMWNRGLSFYITLCGQEIGNAEQAQQLRQLFQNAVDAGQAEFIQRSFETMAEEYRRSHVVLVPTVHSEGTSLSCLEAFGTGRPVIATWVGGLQNLMQDSFNGLMCAPTVEGLEAAMTHILEAPGLLEDLKRGALMTADRFRKSIWDARIRTWLDELSGDQ